MRKLLFLLVIILFTVSNFCSAQVTFQKAIGGTNPDWGNSVRPTTDGGYIIEGTTISGSTFDYYTYLIKTNANGDLTWTKTFLSWGQFGRDVQQTNDGGYIVLSASVFAGAPLLIKTDAAGDTLWTRDLAGDLVATGFSIQQTSDNGYIIAGDQGSYQTSKIDTINALLVKTSSTGEIIWAKSYGGLKHDIGYSVQQTNDNGYILAGSATSFGTDSSDVYLVKTNAIGDTLWTKRYGGTHNDQGTSVKQTCDNGYIIVGTTTSFGAGGNDIYLIKTDNHGNLLWSKTYGGEGYDMGSGIQITTDGGFIISGSTNSFGTNNIYFIKTDNLGNIEWSKTMNGGNPGTVVPTYDGGYIFTGYVISNAVDQDVLLVKTDSEGNSGCNETDAATLTNSAATKMSGTATLVSSKYFKFYTAYPPEVGSVGTETTLCTTVGLHEIKTDNSLLISPNPSSGDFVLTFPGMINQGTVEIYTVMGEQIFSQAFTHSSNLEINFKNNSLGIYFVKVLDGERWYSQKVMIER